MTYFYICRGWIRRVTLKKEREKEIKTTKGVYENNLSATLIFLKPQMLNRLFVKSLCWSFPRLKENQGLLHCHGGWITLKVFGSFSCLLSIGVLRDVGRQKWDVKGIFQVVLEKVGFTNFISYLLQSFVWGRGL